MTHSPHKKQMRAISAKTGKGYQAQLQDRRQSGKSAAPPLPAGWRGFSARVVRVIELAEAEEVEARKREASRVPKYPTSGALDWVSPQPAYAALRDEIESFDDQDARKLIVLMYSGREKLSLRAMHHSLGADEPEHEREQILSKRGPALPQYLRQALKQAREADINLDAPLPDRHLLRALWVAGVSVDSLERWDPEFLGLRRISGGLSHDPEVAERQARENERRGAYALDLGHESITLSREKGEELERYLNEAGVAYSRTRIAARYVAKRAAIRGARQRHVIECLRWPTTFHDQTVAQIWSFTHRAGVSASLAEIRAAAERLARGYLITQKGGDNSDRFTVTAEQLGNLGGPAKPPWAAE